MTNYLKKYLKYKHKYLELKKLTNHQIGAQRKVKTISNGGNIEGMSLQCFWISILDYLRRNGYPELTLRVLRTKAGLGSDTEHTMFDIDYLIGSALNRQPVFFNAATQIARLYDLRIQIYTTTHDGEVTTPRGVIGNGSRQVEIAQFGIAHFELIDETVGDTFIPAVSIKGKLTKTIDPVMRDRYIQLNENQGLLQILNDNLRKLSIVYEHEITQKESISASGEYTIEEKRIFLTQKEQYLQKLVAEINGSETKIARLGEEIATLSLLIREHEEKS